MDGREFYDRVKAHPELEWLGVSEAEPDPESSLVYVARLFEGDRREVWSLRLDTVLGYEWEELEGVLAGRRLPSGLTHLSRIVGYFSKVKNWNRSKLAEHRDRRKGDYNVRGDPGALFARKVVHSTSGGFGAGRGGSQR